jgi:Protein phosphatase 2C
MSLWLVYPAFHTVAFRKKKSPSVATEADGSEAPPEVHTARLSGSEHGRTGPRENLVERLARQQPSYEQPTPHIEAPEAGAAHPPEPDDKTEPPQFLFLPDELSNPDHEFAKEPPLPITLSTAEIEELQDERVVVATHFGPKDQEKASNEDFALGGVLKLRSQGEFAFAAIADGVSTRTFWAARTARIACLTTYKVVRGLLEDGLDLSDPDAIATITGTLAPEIEDRLKADGRRLERAGTVPAGWNPATYRKYKGDLTMWYRSTLLFGVAGEKGSVIGYAGDGAIRTLVMPEGGAGAMIEKCFLRAGDTGQLSNYVSLAFKAAEIQGGRFLHDGRGATHVLLGSDGLDKTLRAFETREGEEKSRYRDLPLGTRAEAFRFLGEIAEHEAADPDNLSVARLSWPLGGRTGRWATWKQEPFARWQPAAAPDGGAGGAPAETERQGDDGYDPDGRNWGRVIILVAGVVLACLAGLGVGLSYIGRGPSGPADIPDLLKADDAARVGKAEHGAKDNAPRKLPDKADAGSTPATVKEPVAEKEKQP